MSASMCNSLTNVFSEFIMYKVNYIDPLILNSTFLMNCYNDTDTYTYDFQYDINFEDINLCIQEGGNSKACLKLCQEYKIGEISDMFIGNLAQLEIFNENLDDILQKGEKLYHDDQITIDQNSHFSPKFFEHTESLNDKSLEVGDLGNI